jgi:hypothetical protein
MLGFTCLQYVVETKYVGERPIPGAATEVVGQERNVVKQQVKEAQAGANLMLPPEHSVLDRRMPLGDHLRLGSIRFVPLLHGCWSLHWRWHRPLNGRLVLVCVQAPARSFWRVWMRPVSG